MTLLLIPNACQLASQGVPLILSASHFMASSKMDGMTLESFITWSMHQDKQTNISFTADPVNQAFSAACSPFHAIFASTKRMSTGFSGCPLGIVNEPFHGLIENGWHDTWVLHHMKHASSQANKYLFHCWPSQSSIFRCIFTISWHFYYYQTHFNWLLRVSPWYCQRAISWPHRKWMAWHLSPSSHEACVKTKKQISLTADPVNQAFSAACSPFHAIFASTKRISTGFSGCPLDIIS